MKANIYKLEEVIKASQQKLFNVVSLFAGCGGSSTGYRLGGGDVLAINEFIPSAYECYEKNYPETFIFKNDVRELTGKMILDQIGFKVGELDILDGSPPCASFSMAGKREKNWGKIKRYSRADNIFQSTDDLFNEYIRLIDEIKPKVFIAENVKGIIQGTAKSILGNNQLDIFDDQKDTILHKMIKCGYNVRYKVLNAKNFGVPQNRERTIFIGLRDDFDIDITYPKPFSENINLGECLVGLDINEDEKKDCYISKSTNAYELLLKMNMGENASKYHPKGHYFSLVRLDFNSIAGTIQASHGTTNGCSHIHPIENRKLTIRELKRIMSFPDDYIISGTFSQQWERIGRSVPPLLMKEISNHVYNTILKHIK
jgi:DNA (cytosine-5)-methyltransferase 1